MRNIDILAKTFEKLGYEPEWYGDSKFLVLNEFGRN